jgi:hypothetical protein
MRHLQWLLFVVTMHSWWIWTNILPWKTHFFLVGFVCPRGSRTFASIENPYCPWVEQMVTGQSFTTNFMFNLLELEFEDRSGSYSEWVIHVRVKRQDPTVSGTCLATCWLLSNSSWPANKKHGRERVCVHPILRVIFWCFFILFSRRWSLVPPICSESLAGWRNFRKLWSEVCWAQVPCCLFQWLGVHDLSIGCFHGLL